MNKRLLLQILDLAQLLLIEELLNGTLFACGNDFTTRACGFYGAYETLDGIIISFTPNNNFKLKIVFDNATFTEDVMALNTIVNHTNENFTLELA